mgnify:CR=1 FL=1
MRAVSEEFTTLGSIFWQYGAAGKDAGEEYVMRMTALVFALVLSISGLASAQEWAEYQNNEDGFKVDLPGQPKVTEITWKSQMEYLLPGKVYSADRGKEHYSITVVDYTNPEALGTERAKTCPPGNAQCRENAGIMGPGYWRHDERGAIMYATSRILLRDVKMTGLMWEWMDMVEGNLVQVTSNVDQSRTFAFIAMHENKLFMFEGTVPKGYPQPGLFQQSVGWVDKDGNSLRYQIIYSNAYHGMGVYPKPGVGNAGRGGPGGPGGGAGAGGGR